MVRVAREILFHAVRVRVVELKKLEERCALSGDKFTVPPVRNATLSDTNWKFGLMNLSINSS